MHCEARYAQIGKFHNDVMALTRAPVTFRMRNSQRSPYRVSKAIAKGASPPQASGSEQSFESFRDRFAFADEATRTQLASDCRAIYNVDYDADAFDSECDEALPTYWLPMGAAPRCFVEQLVEEIFTWHVKRLGLHESSLLSLELAGSEWWTLYLDGSTDEVDWHWDVDGGLRRLGEIRHPFLSTVTYVEAGGSSAPTSIVEGCHKESVLETGQCLVHKVFLSTPRVGKHICFDGRLLHGAPAELGPCFASSRCGSARVTLLVNIW